MFTITSLFVHILTLRNGKNRETNIRASNASLRSFFSPSTRYPLAKSLVHPLAFHRQRAQ